MKKLERKMENLMEFKNTEGDELGRKMTIREKQMRQFSKLGKEQEKKAKSLAHGGHKHKHIHN